ncbi:MAG: Ohr family peroxiredoxin [Alphaproteobacteria bacterium]|nr:MAG: Ohr family peroxiredoxin [Alphaproteobacteria bacterium]
MALQQAHGTVHLHGGGQVHAHLAGGKFHGTDPEQLFACGYAACFGGAVEFAARQMGVNLTAAVQVDSAVSLLKRDEGGFTIGVELLVHLEGVDDAQGQAVVDKAHTICPYSNATRGNIEVSTSVVATPAAA